MQKQLGRFSMGIGDRFGRQGNAQLGAFVEAKERYGIEAVPVWNKSFREHSMIGTVPADVRNEADAAVNALGWDAPYFVDADHINLKTVEGFIAASDFFTLDVADDIGVPAPAEEVEAFIKRHADLCGELELPGLDYPVQISADDVRSAAENYLAAVKHAQKIYGLISERKGAGTFVTEVSMDETETPQTPVDMLIILAAIADAGIPAATVAPKFSGRFNKGVDYVGDTAAFAREFEADLAVIKYAVSAFDLPAGLKLSVHSGSDKFALYPVMRAAMRKQGAGVHLKTAGTTWLEELIGLALAGGDGLRIARKVYAEARGRVDALCAPYATVIDIQESRLPSAETVNEWPGEALAAALRHDPSCPSFNPDLRQLLHVGYKVAAEMGERYTGTLEACEASVAQCVRENILERHLLPLFK